MAFDPTTIFTALAGLFNLGTALSPALIQWIEAKIPAEKQAVMTRRMRRCKRVCKRNHLLSTPLIAHMVDILFEDLQPAQRTEIAEILTAELQPAT